MTKIKLNIINSFNKRNVTIYKHKFDDKIIIKYIAFLYFSKLIIKNDAAFIFSDRIQTIIGFTIYEYFFDDFYIDDEYCYYFENQLEKNNFIRKQKILNLLNNV